MPSPLVVQHVPNGTHKVPKYSAVDSGFRKLAEKEREREREREREGGREGERERSLSQPIDTEKPIAHHIAVKGCAFTDFEDLIELEKLHGVKFQSGSYENKS